MTARLGTDHQMFIMHTYLLSETVNLCIGQNCLQWGRSNLVDPAESPKIRLLNRDFGNILSIFPRKNSKTQSSLNFLSPDPGNLLNPIFRDWPRSGEF